jgi:hypothetical protein
MAESPPFLARWSRLKQRARRQPPAAPPAPRQEADAAAPAEPAPDELPSIDSLDAQSDYRVFMAAKVPDALRNQALRKLWLSDPVFANLDGLVEYGEDYGADFRAVSVVKTVYRVLEGMPAGSEPEEAPGEPSLAEAPPTNGENLPETGADAVDAAPDPADVAMDGPHQSD